MDLQGYLVRTYIIYGRQHIIRTYVLFLVINGKDIIAFGIPPEPACFYCCSSGWSNNIDRLHGGHGYVSQDIFLFFAANLGVLFVVFIFNGIPGTRVLPHFCIFV